MAWMDRYLFDRAVDERSWLKTDSPLNALLQGLASERTARGYGVDYEGSLIPEVVNHAGFRLGRYEVTRAQYQQFDNSYPVEPGDENLPASGLSFEQANDYARWLAKLTEQKFRLPSAAEARQIFNMMKKPAGNTLSWWAGYQPNPEDSSQILSALDAVGQTVPLLKPVGSFAGQGEAPVFDLDGNVAEWVSEEGNGIAFGPSADLPVDSRDTGSVAAPAYRGLRILLDSDTP
jgi:formylglycine-generating enzyme required for sulfatase activity